MCNVVFFSESFEGKQCTLCSFPPKYFTVYFLRVEIFS